MRFCLFVFWVFISARIFELVARRVNQSFIVDPNYLLVVFVCFFSFINNYDVNYPVFLRYIYIDRRQ